MRKREHEGGIERAREIDNEGEGEGEREGEKREGERNKE